jgi:hypothetical protein
MQILEVRICRNPDPQDCKSFLLKIGFHYAQVPFKTGFIVLQERIRIL